MHEPRGFYSQMIFGESFESHLPGVASKNVAVTAPTISINNVGNGGNVRHCNYELCVGGPVCTLLNSLPTTSCLSFGQMEPFVLF